MKPSTSDCSLDFSHCTVEDLVLALQQHWAREVLDVLDCRLRKWREKLTRFLSRHAHLSTSDRDDAQQNAFVAMLDAIRDFSPTPLALEKPCSFRTFARRVITARFKNDLRNY